MSRLQGEKSKKYENLSFWGREFMSLSQKYKESVRKFSFLTRHHIIHDITKLYCYIYIVFFRKHLSELYWIVLCFKILNGLPT